MSIKMDKKNKNILLRLNNVRYNKNYGSLYLLHQYFGWMMDKEDNFQIKIKYTDIRNQKVSAEAKPKVQLQCILDDQVSHTFHFTNPEGKEKQVAERNMIKEKVARLIMLNKQRPMSDLEMKGKDLREIPRLKELYEALVATKVLSPDDFWKEIASLYKQTLHPAQDVGVSGAFLSEIKLEIDGSTGRVSYSIPEDIMKAILKIYPSVKKKYEDHVRDQGTEREFFTRFIQSHYYNVHQICQIDPVFAECAKSDNRELARDINANQNDPLYDLSKIFDDKPMDIGSDLKVTPLCAGSSIIHATMIKRFNQVSSNILKAQVASEKERIYKEMLAKNPDILLNGHSEPTENVMKNKKIRLDEKLHFEDLETDVKVNKAPLVIECKNRYLLGPSPDIIFEDIRTLPTMQRQLSCIVLSWQPNLHVSQSPSTALKVLENLSATSLRGRRCPTPISNVVKLPGDLNSELKKVYSISSELFRHFYSCFPARTKDEKERLQKMYSALWKYYEIVIKGVQEMLLRKYKRDDILEHLVGMFHITNIKYQKWNSRNVRRKVIKKEIL